MKKRILQLILIIIAIGGAVLFQGFNKALDPYLDSFHAAEKKVTTMKIGVGTKDPKTSQELQEAENEAAAASTAAAYRLTPAVISGTVSAVAIFLLLLSFVPKRLRNGHYEMSATDD